MPASTFKRLNISDNFVVPYTANKTWDIPSDSFDKRRIVWNVGINYGSSSIFSPQEYWITNGEYDRLVYNSINLLYYPNFLPTSSNTSSLQNTIYNDGTLSTSSYFNGHVDLGNINTIKYYPAEPKSVIYALNMPKTLTGDKILPKSFELRFPIYLPKSQVETYLKYAEAVGLDFTNINIDTVFDCPSPSNQCSVVGLIRDDGNYNLYYAGTALDNITGINIVNSIPSSIGTDLKVGDYVGNIFYEQNIAVLTVIPNYLRPTAWRGADPFCRRGSGGSGNMGGFGIDLLFPSCDNSICGETYEGYGYLYNWFSIGGNGGRDVGGIVNTSQSDPATLLQYVDERNEWKVPTSGDWDTLINRLGGQFVAGGRLKTTRTSRLDRNCGLWRSPNTGATNIVKWAGVPGSSRSSNGVFQTLNETGNWWSSTDSDTNATFVTLKYLNDNILKLSDNKKQGLSIRLVRPATSIEQSTLVDGTTSNDNPLLPHYVGNSRTYITVKIGTQVWITQNLVEEKYNDGAVINEVTNNTSWSGLIAGARCSYNNNSISFGLGSISLCGTPKEHPLPGSGYGSGLTFGIGISNLD
jgi:uncharacterized protein (TIGR02145 family)